jgi:hypothetical protein
MNNLFIILVLAIILLFLLMKNGSFFGSTTIDKENLIVYGSKTCPWCVKQEDYLTKAGIDYKFVDCSKSQCPDFVNGFPTLLFNNKVMNGYTELGPDLTYPAPVKTQLPF